MLWLSAMGSLLACGDVLRTGGPPAPDALPPTTATAITALPPAEGAVHVLTLAGRTPDLSGFAAATGCTPTILPHRTTYDLWSAANDHPFDVVLATTDVSRRLIRDDILQPIAPPLLSHWDGLADRFRTAPWNTLDGTPFGVPLQWGPQGLLASTEAFPEPPDTWRVLFEEQPLPDGSTTQGRVQAYEGAISLAQVALALMAHDPVLGIDDPYALTKPQFGAALRAVRQQSPIVHSYWQDPDAQVADFASGRVVVADSWVYQARALEQQGVPVAWTLPAEGATAWAVTAMIRRDAPHPGCAYRLADHLASEPAQRAVAEQWASVPARLGTCDAIPQACAAHGLPHIDALHFWRSPERRCGKREDCAALHEWTGQTILARGGL